ncbi:MAG: fumarylacetoacetate hydrolase family protein [Actinobacteria bacterium]|nr:fumarylacetoacetate hydrolase family protein [Actinomycetota bacterium]
MRIARFESGARRGYGKIVGDELVVLDGEPGAWSPSGVRLALSSVRLLAPCIPGKIVCVGLNYARHAAEMKEPPPPEPVLFLKPPTAVSGPGDAIPLPPQSSRVDYEGELAVVIGRAAKGVGERDALDHVLGYTCANDVTARDLQSRDGQWTRAKSFDGFCPLGPWIETEIDPSNLAISTALNGEVRQSSTTGDLIFPVPALVSFVSGIMTLLPGDVILTGTPAGVGPMAAGDRVEVTVQGIGTLRNTAGPRAR